MLLIVILQLIFFLGGRYFFYVLQFVFKNLLQKNIIGCPS